MKISGEGYYLVTALVAGLYSILHAFLFIYSMLKIRLTVSVDNTKADRKRLVDVGNVQILHLRVNYLSNVGLVQKLVAASVSGISFCP